MNSFEKWNVYYGDLHNHCNISYAHGPLTAALENARAQLDFCSVTGHADWPDMPEPDERIQYIIDFHKVGFQKLRKGWDHYLKVVKDHNREGEFVVFPGYEVHSSQEGDYTIVYKGLEGPLLLGSSIEDVKQKLRKQGDVFAFPHHLAYPLGSRGVNWSVLSEDLSPCIEILSMHGISESCESPRPFLHSMGPIDYHSTAQFGLLEGHRFGFLGNTDHHSAYPGSYGHGKTGVWAKSLSREDIWEAIFARRSFALTGDKMDLRFSVGGEPMGSVLDCSGKKQIEFSVNTRAPIEMVEVIKNNQVIRTLIPDAKENEGAFPLHLFLEMGWGEKKSSCQWEVKIGTPSGQIRDIEPRFRGLEVVSPVERDKGIEMPFRNGSYEQVGESSLYLEVTSQGNPTNLTPATQGIAFTVEGADLLRATLNGQTFEIPISRLLQGSFARNLGKIDSPAFRFHRVPQPWETQLTGSFEDEASANDFYYLRVKQRNNQWAYASPVFIT